MAPTGARENLGGLQEGARFSRDPVLNLRLPHCWGWLLELVHVLVCVLEGRGEQQCSSLLTHRTAVRTEEGDV